MKKDQLIEFVIRPVLKAMKAYSQEAEDLLVMIAAHESSKGRYIHQVQGPAVGIYQMEPATHDHIIKWLKVSREKLYAQTLTWVGIPHCVYMIGNLYYATFMARAFFLRFPEPLPNTHILMAEYAKWRWNTEKGKATAEDYLKAFEQWDNKS